MTDRPTDLCQYGNCVINGPGIVGGDCVCDGKPITTPGSLADKRLASAIRQIDSLKSHLETAQENSAFIVTSLKRTIAERDATIRSLSLKVEELEKGKWLPIETAPKDYTRFLWRAVTQRDIEATPFAADLGLELGGHCYELTAKGQALLKSREAKP